MEDLTGVYASNLSLYNLNTLRVELFAHQRYGFPSEAAYTAWKLLMVSLGIESINFRD